MPPHVLPWVIQHIKLAALTQACLLPQQIVGGDSISVQAKYKTGTTQQFPTKLVFLMNDAPTFANADAFAIERRIWNIPMRAQRLGLDNAKQRNDLSVQGKSHYIFEKDPGFLENLIQHHIPAYQKWCVEGATNYFKNKMSLYIPLTIDLASPINADELMDLFTTCIKESFVSADEKSRISSSEIKEVFLIRDKHIDIDSKVDNALNKKLKSILTDPKYHSGTRAFDRCKSIRFMFPTRKEGEDYTKQNGYSGIAWAPGPLASIVNELMKTYNKDTRPPIAAAPLDAEDEI